MQYSLSCAFLNLSGLQLLSLTAGTFMFLLSFFVLRNFLKRKISRDLDRYEQELEDFIKDPGYDIQDDVLRDELHS